MKTSDSICIEHVPEQYIRLGLATIAVLLADPNSNDDCSSPLVPPGQWRMLTS